MNKLSGAKRTQVVAALVEGNSIRATVRMTGVAKRETLVNLRCKRIQCDELWSFVYAKAKNSPPPPGFEDSTKPFADPKKPPPAAN
jgi:hypothetical protein